MKLLLTGGRAPATLELVRLFSAAGHSALVAESMPWHLCRFSRCLERSYRVPSPRLAPDKFIQALLNIICREQVDLLVPTCEEIFYVALGRKQLTPHCRVLADSIDQLNRLHNKWQFAQLARRIPKVRTICFI